MAPLTPPSSQVSPPIVLQTLVFLVFLVFLLFLESFCYPRSFSHFLDLFCYPRSFDKYPATQCYPWPGGQIVQRSKTKFDPTQLDLFMVLVCLVFFCYLRDPEQHIHTLRRFIDILLTSCLLKAQGSKPTFFKRI